MTTHRNASLLVATLGLITLLGPATAHAQQSPRDPQANSLVRQAMQDYQDLEIDRAVQRLDIALRTCGASGCSNGVLARVHMSIGIVRVGGQQNQSEGVAAMARALELDPHAEPDTLLATPEINEAFAEARRSSGRGSTGNTGNTSNTTQPRNNPPAASGDLLHTPAPEQIENTPLPVYVEPAGTLNAAHVYVFFRGNGMRQYERREMQRMSPGWGTEIPCVQIMQPGIDYYVTAVDDGGSTLASTGSESSPVHVSVLSASTRRSFPAPSLPNRAAPASCASCEDCPPGMTGPNCCVRGGSSSSGSGGEHGHGQLGDPCSSSSECGEGMRCDGGACAVDNGESSGGGGEEPGPSTPSRAFSRFAFDLGGGVGGAFLSGTPSYAEQFINATTRQPECGTFTCYRTIDPGLAPTFFLNANIRYNVTQRVGIAIGTRFQFDTAPWTVDPPGGRGQSKSNPLANILLYGRLYYAFTPAGFAPTGVVASAFVGGGAGQIEPKPGVPASARYPSAHVVSGYGNIHVGGRVEYGLRNGFHVAGELTLQFMVPTFLFDADLSALVGFHF
ncbi:MAG: hypothetical protein U0326_23115 [Polyangiales bacterium]